MHAARNSVPDMQATQNICVGMIVAAHGIKGEVKVKSFTEDAAKLASYGPLLDETGTRKFDLTVNAVTKGAVIAAIKGIGNRNAAEALKGTKLFVPRGALPELAEEEFYHADLIGLTVELCDGTALGAVIAVHNFGAGDVIEVKRTTGGTLDIPFTDKVVPVVDIEGGRIVIEPPVGLIDKPSAGPKSRRRRPHAS